MTYDAIVIGARAAGSPTAMLLARKGYDVLAVDRATFPSDTLSTHVIHAPGVAALQRWGLLDAVARDRLPADHRVPVRLRAGHDQRHHPPGRRASTTAYAPRRTVLDAILVDAAPARPASRSGEGFNVDEVLVRGRHGSSGIRRGDARGPGPDRHRRRRPEQPRRQGVHAADYDTKPRLQYSYYTYFSGLPTDEFETYIRPDRGSPCAPTNDGLTMVVAGWPYAEAAGLQGRRRGQLPPDPRAGSGLRRAGGDGDTGGALPRRSGTELVPQALRRRVGAGRRRRLQQGPDHRAGHHRRLPRRRALRRRDRTSGSARARPFDEVMGAWHQERDAKAMPIYEFTAQLATLEPPPPEMQQLLAAVHGNQQAMDAFVSVVSGAVSPVDFFSEENIGTHLRRSRGPRTHQRWQAASDEPLCRDSRSRSGLDGWERRLRATGRGPTCGVHELPRRRGLRAVRRAAGWQREWSHPHPADRRSCQRGRRSSPPVG